MLELLALAAAGTIAGVVNVVAGGGSLLSIPLLVFFGLPATEANGTNRVAILLQNVGASASFHGRGLVPWGWVRLGAPPALVGAAIGTWAAVNVGDVAFRRLLAVVMVGAAVIMVWRPVFLRAFERRTTGERRTGNRAAPEGSGTPPPVRRSVATVLGFFAMGFYGGLVQAGIGFLALGFFASLHMDLIRANALKVATILAFTPLTLLLFALDGSVDWVYGSALALGNLAGGVIGVRLQVLKGNRWVRGFVTATVALFAVRLLMP